MPTIEVYECASIIKAILNMALFDALSFKKPKKPKPFKRPIGSRKKNKYLNPDYVSTDPQYLAWDARRFLRKDNVLFCYYCELIEIDPEYLAERIKRSTKIIDRSKEGLSANIETLSEMISAGIAKNKINYRKKIKLY